MILHTDQIKLKGLKFYGYHGVFEEENTLGQRYEVDVTLFLPLKKAGQTDDLNYSIDYGKVYLLIKDIVEGQRKKLIEALAETISEQLFYTFSSLRACQLKITKPNPPIDGIYDGVAVQIFRERDQ